MAAIYAQAVTTGNQSVGVLARTELHTALQMTPIIATMDSLYIAATGVAPTIMVILADLVIMIAATIADFMMIKITNELYSELMSNTSNIDGSAPNASYVGGMAFSPVREYKSKDETLGFGDKGNDHEKLDDDLDCLSIFVGVQAAKR